MTHRHPTAEQQNALKAYIENPKREIHQHRFVIDELVNLNEKDEIPETYLTFEILERMAIAKENCFSNDDILDIVPSKYASETVGIPIFVLNVLLNAWDDFTHSDPTTANMAKSFGLAAKKRRGRPIMHIIDKLEQDRYYASQVLDKRIKGFFKNRKISLTSAFTDVATSEKVSYETVKNAWGKHNNYFKKMLRNLKVPDKLG